MRQVMVIVVVGMMLGGCGTDSTRIPQDCWNDNDCPVHSKCLNDKCVYEPECETSTDCDLSQGIICDENYQCNHYTDNDPCFEQECSNTCATCGIYTTCIDGICEDACLERERIRAEIWDIVCDDILNVQNIACDICYHWVDGIRIDIPCSNKGAIAAKKELEAGIEQFKQDVENKLRGSCL